MGGTTSTAIADHVYSATDRAAALRNLDSRLDALRREIQDRPQAITKGVANTVSAVSDAMILRYSQLQDTSLIEKNVGELFQKFPGREHVINATRDMMLSMRSTKSSRLQGWKHRKKFMTHKGKELGVEIHYKTEMIEDVSTAHNRDTVVLIAYKCLAHVMDPKVSHRYMDVDQLSESMMSMNIRGTSLEVSSCSYSSYGPSTAHSDDPYHESGATSNSVSYRVVTRKKVHRSITKLTPPHPSDEDSDEDTSAVKTKPNAESESDEDSDCVCSSSGILKQGSTSDEGSDEEPSSRYSPQPNAAWPPTLSAQVPSPMFGSGFYSRSLLPRRLNGEWPFSFEW